MERRIFPHIYDQRNFQPGCQDQEEKESFQQMVLEKLDIHMKKEFEPQDGSII